MPSRVNKLRLLCRVFNLVSADKNISSHMVGASRNFSTSQKLDMRFVQFVNKNGGPQQLGVQLKPGGDVVAISTLNSNIPNTLRKFLEGEETVIKKAQSPHINLMEAMEAKQAIEVHVTHVPHMALVY